MIKLVYGGSGSGKSQFAESMLKNQSNKYYIATMKINDDEDRWRVNRHREMRKDKNFTTIEASRDVDNILNLIDMSSPCNILLECMSNLVANEMFRDGAIVSKDNVFEKLTLELDKLFEKIDEIVIVSNNIFEDGLIYDDITIGYLQVLAKINNYIAAKACQVWEVVVGIPIRIK